MDIGHNSRCTNFEFRAFLLKLKTTSNGKLFFSGLLRTDDDQCHDNYVSITCVKLPNAKVVSMCYTDAIKLFILKILVSYGSMDAGARRANISRCAGMLAQGNSWKTSRRKQE
ncbi:hypothetical protein T02_11760 [Trichinella nativa]|uniref:Uncharacterized protein n=1 Tax=Trichinella nativa TaxID=6335 RepID=A0A0V1LVR9_9BILA|nr:hypothetical protein T02_11760 [Trichinella nativa]